MFSMILAGLLFQNSDAEQFTCMPIEAALFEYDDDAETSVKAPQRMQMSFSVSPDGEITQSSEDDGTTLKRLQLSEPFRLAVSSEEVKLTWLDGLINIDELGRWTFGNFGNAYFAGAPNCLETESYCDQDAQLRRLTDGTIALTFNMMSSLRNIHGETSPLRYLVATAHCQAEVR